MNTSVVSAAILEGNLIIGLSDGSVINCGFVQGPQGLSGPQGPMGSTGDNGLDGNTIHTVAGTPGNEMGTDGDYAIDNINWRIYGPKSGGVWGRAKSMLPDAENMLANGRMPSGSPGGGGGSGEGGGGGGGIIYTNTVQLTNPVTTLLRSTANYKIIPNAPAGTTNQEGANLWGFGSAFDNFDAAIPVATGSIPPAALPGFTDNWDGRLWFDSSEEELTLYIYNDGVWIPAAPPVSLDGINATIEAGLLVQAEIIERVISGEGIQDTIQAEQITQDGQISTLTEKANANEGRITVNELAITNLEVTKGSVARYKVEDTVLEVASRKGQLYTNGNAASSITMLSFATLDLNGNNTKPIDDGDIVEFDFGNSVVRYTAGGSSIAALPVTYNDGSHSFSAGEEMDVYIYPQNKQGASKDYVDAADALKYDKTGGYITGAVKVKVSDPSAVSCYSIYEPGNTRTYYIWNPGGSGGNIKHVCSEDSDFEVTTSTTVDGSKKVMTPAVFGYKNVTLSGGDIRPQSASKDVTVSHTINTKHTFEGRAIFELPAAGNGFCVKGNGTSEEDYLLSVYHNSGGATLDAVNYWGRTDSNTNIQTKKSVDALIAEAGVAATPVGAIMMWMNPTAPPGWFKMIGIDFDIEKYPLLHAYLSITDGYVSGKIPNWRDHYAVGCGNDTSASNDDLGKKFGYKTAAPQNNFQTANRIPNGGVRTFNGAGNTKAYSDAIDHATISGGDSVTRPKSVAIHFIIKHD